MPGGAYAILEQKADAIGTKNRLTGWGYVISGGAALAISIPGFYLSADLFAKAIYGVGQTLGVASVGYGSYLVLVENDYTRFKSVIDRVDLRLAQREELAHEFLRENAERARAVRKIRVISHGLTAGLNFLNAATASYPELKTALYFVAGINTLAALSFGLARSEEENLVDGIGHPESSRGAHDRVQLELVAGPGMAALRWSF